MSNYFLLILAIFVFGGIAIHNTFVGIKTTREMQVGRQKVFWYEQPTILLAISCTIILFILLLDFSINNVFHSAVGMLLLFLRVLEIFLIVLAGLGLFSALLAKRKQKQP